MDNKKLVDNLVFKGLLPISFANSKIIKMEDVLNQNKIESELKINKRYKQKELPEGYSQVLISKIYDLY